MAILTSVFENQKVDMRSQLSGLLPTNMGEELPTEGPLSMGALYSPVWALSQKGVGGGFCLYTLYIYIYIFKTRGGAGDVNPHFGHRPFGPKMGDLKVK